LNHEFEFISAYFTEFVRILANFRETQCSAPSPPIDCLIFLLLLISTRTISSSQSTGTRTETFLSFFQSLLPSFNAQNMNRPGVVGAGAGAGAGGQEAAAQANNEIMEGAANFANEMGRFDMNQMVERLREFLLNIEQNFPAVGNAGNADNNENDHENNDLNPDMDEYD
jgi:hypothetical protein